MKKFCGLLAAARQIDALSHYKRYTDIFDYDDVPEEERKEVARSVSGWVMENLNNASTGIESECAAPGAKGGCCG
ncbi:MAG: hypothetical protein JRJ46_07950 [Deltaproteobacteria bacterium]|nr:hypothetical protein [Deltaproteobacteria bacterium]